MAQYLFVARFATLWAMGTSTSAQSITLIGMPGSGKSTVGRALAEALDVGFLDVDTVVEAAEGGCLMELIERHGPEAFLDIECKHIRSLAPGRRIIAPGGSVVYRDDAMQHLATLGPIVYLRCTLASLHVRLGDLTARGVVMAEGQNLDTLYAERTALYEKYADIVVDSDAGPVHDVVHAITAQLGFARANGC